MDPTDGVASAGGKPGESLEWVFADLMRTELAQGVDPVMSPPRVVAAPRAAAAAATRRRRVKVSSEGVELPGDTAWLAEEAAGSPRWRSLAQGAAHLGPSEAATGSNRRWRPALAVAAVLVAVGGVGLAFTLVGSGKPGTGPDHAARRVLTADTTVPGVAVWPTADTVPSWTGVPSSSAGPVPNVGTSTANARSRHVTVIATHPRSAPISTTPPRTTTTETTLSVPVATVTPPKKPTTPPATSHNTIPGSIPTYTLPTVPTRSVPTYTVPTRPTLPTTPPPSSPSTSQPSA